MATVRLDEAALRALESSSDMKSILDSLGGQVAERAKASAPRRTGEGAESIGHEVTVDSTGAHVRVSWAPERFYMLFAELGTSKLPARPFLRPALEGDYTP